MKKASILRKNEALVPGAGIEPALPKELDFESSASTNSATQASVELDGKNTWLFRFS